MTTSIQGVVLGRAGSDDLDRARRPFLRLADAPAAYALAADKKAGVVKVSVLP